MGGWIRRGWIFGVFGAPRFSVQRSQNACFKGVLGPNLGPLDGKSGRPKNAKSNKNTLYVNVI